MANLSTPWYNGLTRLDKFFFLFLSLARWNFMTSSGKLLIRQMIENCRLPHVRWLYRIREVHNHCCSLQVQSTASGHCLWVSWFQWISITVSFSTNEWKSNDNLAQPKVYTAHPKYNSRAIDYDYAFIELTEPLTFTEFVRPITIVPPNENSNNNNELYGETAVTSGWGYSL